MRALPIALTLLTLFACKPNPPAELINVEVRANLERATIHFVLNDKGGEYVKAAGTLVATVKDGAALTCATTIAVPEEVPYDAWLKHHTVTGTFAPPCPAEDGVERKATLVFTSAKGDRVETVVPLMNEAAAPVAAAPPPVEEPEGPPAPEPWPPNPDGPPAVVSMSENAEATLTRNLELAEKLMKEGKDPTNPCQGAMVLNRIGDRKQEAEVRRVCVSGATLFWATQLAAKIDAAKKAKKKSVDDCARARDFLVMAQSEPPREALLKRLEGSCGPEPRCTVSTPEAEVSGENGGLPCSVAELLARSMRSKGLEPRVLRR